MLKRALSHPSQNLLELELTICGLDSASLPLLGSKLPATIKALALVGVSIDAEAVQAFSLGLPVTLEKLILERTSLGDAGDEVIAARLAQLSLLSELGLRGNDLTEIGARSLAEHLPLSLVALDLGYGRPGPASAQALAPHLPPSLVKLDLRFAQLGNTGALAIAARLTELAALAELRLHGNHIGAVGAPLHSYSVGSGP